MTRPTRPHTDPIWLAGFGDGRAATGYNDRLWARGIVVNGKGGRVAIVSIDLIGYFNAEVQNIRALVDPASKIDYLTVASTPTAASPTRDSPSWRRGVSSRRSRCSRPS